MRRILLLAAVLTVSLPAAAEAAVIPSVSAGTLSVTGDSAADSITLRLTSPTTVDVNGAGFDRATFSRVEIRSGAGADTIRIADTLTEAVTIESGAGTDTVIGGPGAETIATGDDTDFVQPGGGDDSVLLGNGDDTALQGDGFDALDGGAGTDTLRAVGTAESEEFTLQANGAKARIALDTRPSTTDSTAVETLDVTAAGGADLVDLGALDGTAVRNVTADLGFLDGARDAINVQGSDGFDNIGIRPFNDTVRVEDSGSTVTIENAVAADDRLTVFGRGGVDFISPDRTAGARIALTLDGGADTDVIDGSDADDILRGGPGADTITARKGNDTVDLGDGDDSFTRTVADGLDHVEGGAGVDLFSAAGTESDDFIEVQGLLARTRLVYGFSGSADMGGIEHISMNPFGGTDNVTIRDLGGTATTKVDVRLNTADLRVDSLTVIGTQGLDKIKAASSGTTHTVSGLPATVNLIDPERGTKFAIDARDGDDTVEATGITRDTLQPTFKGGAGRDTIIGSPGDDTIAGGTGVDVALMGGGLDTFTWGPGEGNDIVEGQGGTDFLQMNGSGGNDRFDVLPVGSRTRVTRDIENVNLDLGGLERVDILPGPGGDILRVADLSGTSTDRVDFNLSVARGQIGGDNTIDRVFIDGTFGNDTINVNGAGPDVRTTGLAAITTVRGTDPELDRLHVDTKPGVDSLTVTGTTNQLIGFTQS
jgi:Ca2+-binding RTX toxin-like protein